MRRTKLGLSPHNVHPMRAGATRRTKCGAQSAAVVLIIVVRTPATTAPPRTGGGPLPAQLTFARAAARPSG
jgi:hypothetical protein